MSKKVYEIITARITAKMEAGQIPWHQPWYMNGNGAVNYKSQKPYRGINALLLEDGEYATFKQITEAGGKIKKGENAHIVCFWKWLDIKDEKTGESNRVPFLRYYNVFEISQCEGLESKRKKVKPVKHNIIKEAEAIINGYVDKPSISYGKKAYYKPATDSVVVPTLGNFKNAESYYGVLFHELAHSTGSANRLKRAGIVTSNGFGSELYSKEELVAELSASMLCGICGIEAKVLDNSAAYLQSWLKALKNDNSMIVYAASQAQKAADYIRGIKPEYEKEAE